MNTLITLTLAAAYAGVFFAGLGILLLGVSQIMKADAQQKSKQAES